MLGVNYRSSSSSCPSPPQRSALSVYENGLEQNILNTLPRLSSHSKPIVQPERTLPHQPSPCLDFEEAMGFQSIISIPSHNTTAPKSSAELREEIATLEAEIVHLERYLLSLYRTAFEEHLHTLSHISGTHLEYKTGLQTSIVPNNSCNRLETQMQNSGFIHYDQTSPAQDMSISDIDNSASGLKIDYKRDKKFAGSGHHSLADHLCASHMDTDLNTHDRLSEDILRCISSIYCKLANTPHSYAGLSKSPTSSYSSSSIFSSKNPCDSWSPHCFEDVSVRYQGLKEERGSHSHAAMIEVLKIYLDDNSFNYAAEMLQNFRSLVRNLEKVDPRKMNWEEKLAFWINIHNALVMHAYLAYGTGSRVKRTSILKAAYNVGGHCVDAYDIQSSILGIRPHYSAPWLQTLFSPGRKIKTGRAKHVYALEYPEPLVHFALCSGAFSDPVVRVYTSKHIFHDLKLAKEEFILSSVYFHKESKIFLPKILYRFAKDMSLDVPDLLELITGCVPVVQRKAIRKCIKGKHDKYINWIPQSSTFRYVIHGDFAKGR